jgi:septum formation protein
LVHLFRDFEVLVPGIDEEALQRPIPELTVTELAIAKAEAVRRIRPDAIIIAADTVVCIGQETLNKPKDEAEARMMLRELSGGSHRVLTGVCLTWPLGQETFWEETTVRFRELDPDEIAAYVATGEPMDKAGAYAIQGDRTSVV